MSRWAWPHPHECPRLQQPAPDRFLTLLLLTFVISLLVSFLVARLFERPIQQILGRLVPEDLTGAWHRYLTFAIYVVGISGGVRIWSLERYILPREHAETACSLIAYVVVRGLELRRASNA